MNEPTSQSADQGSARSDLEELRVMRGLTWAPHDLWDAGTVCVEGRLSTGEVVEVATVARVVRERAEVCDAWMHGKVYEIADARPATVVTGCDRLTPATIAEALRRRRLQRLEVEAS